MEIFVSHITEECEIAQAFQKWIVLALGAECRVFVSSDDESISLGDKWLESVTNSIKQSDVLLVLCSQASIHRPWINFEAGCGWSLDKPTIPICYGGLMKDQLPPPLNYLQSVDLDSELPTRLLNAICTHFDVDKVNPSVLEGMFEELEDAVSIASPKAAPPVPATSAAVVVEDSDTVKLNDDQTRILKFLADEQGRNVRSSARTIAADTKLHDAKVGYHLQELSNSDFLHGSGVGNRPDWYHIRPKGIAYLVEHNLI